MLATFIKGRTQTTKKTAAMVFIASMTDYTEAWQRGLHTRGGCDGRVTNLACRENKSLSRQLRVAVAKVRDLLAKESSVGL